MSIDYQKWTDIALSDQEFPREEALKILTDPSVDIIKLASAAGDVRIKYFGKKVKVHQINNIQNGLCPEDCGYCGQSKDAEADLNMYSLKEEESIIQEAHEAKAKGVARYCMVASGRGPSDKRTDQLARIVQRINDEVGIKTCLSVGLVNDEQAVKLKNAGLDRLNHNLNTSERHTPNIVNTHTYQDRIDTLDAAKKAGLDNCAGMIVGLGEIIDDILDVAYELRERKVPSIPINFLVPIEGNKLYDFGQLTPEHCLKILCVFRFINAEAEIRMGGGREGHLRSLQSMALYPANSLFIEGYLVTRGDRKNKAFRMIEDAGFEIDGIKLDEIEESQSQDSDFEIDDNPDIMHPKTAKPAKALASSGPCAGSGSCGGH